LGQERLPDPDRLLAGLSDAELSARLVEVFSAEQVLAAQRLALIAEVDGRGLPRREGATGTTAWLRDTLRVSVKTAARMLRLARELGTTALSPTAASLANGAINTEQAAVITRVISGLPQDLDASIRARAQQVLLGHANQFAAHELAVLGSRVLEHVAPEVAEEHQRRQLERQEAKAWRDRGFDLSADGSGRVRVRGLLDTESAATVSAAIGSLCAPSQSGPKHGPGGQSEKDPDSGASDERTATQKRADALVEVCRLALACGELPAHGGELPQLILTMPYRPPEAAAQQGTGATTSTAATTPQAEADHVPAPEPTPQRSRPEADHGPVARLDSGEVVSPAAARRMACDAKVMPVVLGGAGQVLDVGRMRRLFTGVIRKALMVRDRGCAFPACDRPPRWTEGHHIRHWLDGGVTSVDNGVLLCRWHHWLVHEGNWVVRIGSDRLPEFVPPSYVDPQRRPRRNLLHRRT
jgi:hypothetical protein